MKAEWIYCPEHGQAKRLPALNLVNWLTAHTFCAGGLQYLTTAELHVLVSMIPDL